MAQFPLKIIQRRLIIDLDAAYLEIRISTSGEDLNQGTPESSRATTTRKVWQGQELSRATGRRPSELVGTIQLSPDLSATYLVLLYPSERLKELWQSAPTLDTPWTEK